MQIAYTKETATEFCARIELNESDITAIIDNWDMVVDMDFGDWGANMSVNEAFDFLVQPSNPAPKQSLTVLLVPCIAREIKYQEEHGQEDIETLH
jgi:hypothetical protein